MCPRRGIFRAGNRARVVGMAQGEDRIFREGRQAMCATACNAAVGVAHGRRNQIEAMNNQQAGGVMWHANANLGSIHRTPTPKPHIPNVAK